MARPAPELLTTATPDDLPEGVTSEQYDEYIDHIMDSKTPEEAIDLVWPESTDAELTERASANGKALGKALADAGSPLIHDSPWDADDTTSARTAIEEAHKALDDAGVPSRPLRRLDERIAELGKMRDELEGENVRLRTGEVRPAYMLSDINGMAVGWSTCGNCDTHIKSCACPAGPVEPRYFDKVRELDKHNQQRLDARSAPGSIPAVDRLSESTKVTEKVLAANGAGKKAGAKPDGKSKLVPCKVGEHLAAVDQTDRNDDGTYTCFEHQAAAAERTGE